MDLNSLQQMSSVTSDNSGIMQQQQNSHQHFGSEKKHKHYNDAAKFLQVPEKRARFERTADMLAKSGLLEITVKTAELLRSNQEARQDLVNLKQDVDQFVQSVLANPENQHPRLHQSRNMFAGNPLNIEDVPASPKVSVIRSHSTMSGNSQML